ncbi:MAG: transcriptional regulator, partial [Burkholderiales bacterium]
PLFTWYHAAIAPIGHPLLGLAAVTLADLAAHDVITYDPEFAGRRHIDAAFRQAGVAPRIVLEATDSDVIKTYVALGLGVGIVSELALGEEDDRRYRSLPIGRPFRANVTRIAYRAGHMLRGFEREFVELMRRPEPGAQAAGGGRRSMEDERS